MMFGLTKSTITFCLAGQHLPAMCIFQDIPLLCCGKYLFVNFWVYLLHVIFELNVNICDLKDKMSNCIWLEKVKTFFELCVHQVRQPLTFEGTHTEYFIRGISHVREMHKWNNSFSFHTYRLWVLRDMWMLSNKLWIIKMCR